MRLRLLPLSIAAIVATTIIPLKLRWPSLAFLDTSISRSDVVNNLLLYLPLGVSLVESSFARCAGVALGLSALAELLQFGYVDRNPSPIDVTSNVLGAAAGFFAARLIRRFAGFKHVTISVIRPLAALSLGIAALSIFALAWHRTRSDFSNWDPSFQLAVGNELTGDRPWEGNIEGLAIYPNAISSAAIAHFAVTGPSGLLSTQGDGCPLCAINADRMKGAPAPILVRTGWGANLAGGESLLKDDEARKFFMALQRAGNLTIVVWIIPGNVQQTGPARIVTYSRDIYSRNFTLGQMARSLTFRLRTPNTGGNGTNPASFTPPVLQAGHESFLAVTYDGAVSKIYADGKLISHANLGARRPSFPRIVLRLLPSSLPIPELEANICEIVIGSLASIGLLGLLRRSLTNRRTMWRVAALTGAVCGGLIWIFCVWEPAVGLRIFLLTLGGALLIPYAQEPSRVRSSDAIS